MVLCVVLGCSNRSGRNKDVSFYRIPSVITNRGPRDKELSMKRRDGYIAAISGLAEGIIKCVCVWQISIVLICQQLKFII